MFKKVTLKIFIFVFISAGVFGASFNFSQAALNLNGRILLQVEEQGQAWYVNPVNARRYYLGRPDDAFNVMRSLGLGVSNADLNSFLNHAPARLAGRILLQVQDKGQAYYVEPQELELYYLGRPLDAFNLMRARGLGITNADLEKIPVATLSRETPTTSAVTDNKEIIRLAFKYQNNYREIFLPLSPGLYQAYASTPKVYSYPTGQPPLDVRDAFYSLFLKLKAGDTSIAEIVATARQVASQNNWTEDQTAEFVLALVQYIPYDNAKVVFDSNPNPYFPYETLYLNKGVCSDKTFLAVALLRTLGYGAAILDFPDINHTAAGLSCPLDLSLNNSGYCYVETTNYFPISVIPQSINGQATTTTDFFNLFNFDELGKIEVKQATVGKVYQGAAAIKRQVDNFSAQQADLSSRQTEMNTLQAALDSQENDLSLMKAQLDTYYASDQFNRYNSLVSVYNNLANQYNAALEVYSTKVTEYNLRAAGLNQAVKNFYQQ